MKANGMRMTVFKTDGTVEQLAQGSRYLVR